MRRSNIVTRRDLERVYGDQVPGDFVPTHIVRILEVTSRNILRLDYVRLSSPNAQGIRFGYVPGTEDAPYAVLTTGKWQSLDIHGILHDEVARYLPEYTPPRSCDGHVYFVQAGEGGPVKVGWSQDVPRRIAELQTANAARLKLLGTIRGRMSKEAEVHDKLSHLRLGGEWFRDAPELRELVQSSR